MLCSGFQLLIQVVAVGCKLCTVLSESFCLDVNNLHIPHDKKNSDKTVHNLKLPSP